MASRATVLDALPGDVGSIAMTLQAKPSEVRRLLKALETSRQVTHDAVKGVLVYRRA